MKLTISQEGSNPITIRNIEGIQFNKTSITEKNLSKMDKKIYTSEDDDYDKLKLPEATRRLLEVLDELIKECKDSKIKKELIISKYSIIDHWKYERKLTKSEVYNITANWVAAGLGGSVVTAGLTPLIGDLGILAGIASVYSIVGLIAGKNGIMNRLLKFGNFADAHEILDSPKLHSIIQNKILNKYNDFPTIEQVKSDPRAKSKVGFFKWLLTGDSSGRVVKDHLHNMNLLVRKVDNVPVVLANMIGQYLGSTTNLVVVTAIVKNKNGDIKSIPLGTCYVTDNNLNVSRECADIFYGKGDVILTKNQIMKLAHGMESASPVDKVKFIKVFTM